MPEPGSDVANSVADYESRTALHRFKRGAPQRGPFPPCNAVYFTSVPLSVTESRLASHLDACGIRERPNQLKLLPAQPAASGLDPKRSGFVHFPTTAGAMEAVALANNTEIDGSVIRLAFSSRPAGAGSGGDSGRPRGVSGGGGGSGTITIDRDPARDRLRELDAARAREQHRDRDRDRDKDRARSRSASASSPSGAGAGGAAAGNARGAADGEEGSGFLEDRLGDPSSAPTSPAEEQLVAPQIDDEDEPDARASASGNHKHTTAAASSDNDGRRDASDDSQPPSRSSSPVAETAAS